MGYGSSALSSNLINHNQFIIEVAQGYATETNKGKDINKGIAFKDNKAYVGFANGCARISEFGELDCDPKYNFYNTYDRMYKENKSLSVIPQDIEEHFKELEPESHFKLPYTGFSAFLMEAMKSPEDIRFSRLIIQPMKTKIKDGEIKIAFEVEDGKKVFKYKDNKPFYIDKVSTIKEEDVEPGKVYICSLGFETTGGYYLDVKKELFEGIAFGVLNSGGYAKAITQETLNFNNRTLYPEERVLYLPCEIEDLKFKCIHLNCANVINTMKLFRYFDTIDVHVGKEMIFGHIVGFVGEVKDAGYPLIEAMLLPIDNRWKGDIC